MPANAPVNETDREIVLTRIFDAPPETVFAVWTDPKHLPHWYGPNGFTTTIKEIDVRPGGIWRLVMRGPDGVDYHNRIVFLEVDKPDRLVYKHQPEKDDESGNHEVTVTFAPEPGMKTKLTLRMLFPSAADREYVVTRHGAIEGGKQTLGRLASHLDRMLGRDLLITRVFDAPRDLVFKAWTEPARVSQWWGPTGFTAPRCELDLRPGGAIRIDMRGPDGTIYPMGGTFRQIDEPNQLIFTSYPLDANGEPEFEGLNTVTFDEDDGKTKITLHVSVSKRTAEGDKHLAGMEPGWNLTLDCLAAYLACPDRDDLNNPNSTAANVTRLSPAPA